MTQFVYLSNALSGTISRYRLEHGELILLGETQVGEMVMPMTVSHCRQFLYAAIRSEPFRIVKLLIDHQTGELSLEQEVPCESSIVSLNTASQNDWLLGASFNHNLLLLKSIQAGKLSVENTTIARDGHCHMFRFSPDEQWMVASEFGQDRVLVYPRPDNKGVIVECNEQYVFPKGSGPRHMVFSPCGCYLYVLCEMSANVMTFAFDTQKGSLTLIGECEVLPLKQVGLEKGLPPADRVAGDVPRAWCADIQITNNGRFIYISERTLSVIACLEISPDNSVPRYLHHQQVEKQPRSFLITKDDNYMLVSGELSDEIGLYQVDAQSGVIERVSSAPCGKGAAWVCVVDCLLS